LQSQDVDYMDNSVKHQACSNVSVAL